MIRRDADGVLTADGVRLDEVAARFGAPCYVYSRGVLESAYARLRAAFAPAELRYAVKANGNLEILRMLSGWGCGFDIVSGGELARVLEAGGDAEKTVFSGVGKSRAEVEFALRSNIGCFNAESAGEVGRIAEVAAELGVCGRVALRVIPDVDAETHPHLTTGLSGGKFGIPMADAAELARRMLESRHLEFAGLSCHLGSQIREAGIFGEAAARMAELAAELERAGVPVLQVDMGGGFAVAYREGESSCDAEECGRILFSHFDSGRTKLLVEPGRSLTAAMGVLLTRVEHVKSGGDGRGKVIIVDAGMNDLLRPALYDAYHRIVPVCAGSGNGGKELGVNKLGGDVGSGLGGSGGDALVAGPVCESADILGRERDLEVAEGDLLAILDVGAYGMTMASNYNARVRACEVLTEGGEFRLIRRRETMDDLLSAERL